MGKKRKFSHGGKKAQGGGEMDDPKSVMHQPCLIDPTSRGYTYDEVDDFEDRTDALALTRASKMMARRSQDREQVLGIDGSEDDDDDDVDEHDEDSDEDELYMDDDIEDEPKELDPDDRAWGKNKRRYIGTDTTDERIHKQMRGEDEELTRLEEEAARKLQERLAAELDHLPTDDLIPLEEEKTTKERKVESALELNLSGLSRSKKLQLLRTESPEFMPLMEDLKEKCEELQVLLSPLMEGVKGGLVTSRAACQYITTKYRLVLNYVCNVSAYMMLKTSQTSLKNHPVLGRLAQYRQLLQELGPCDKQLEPHLKTLIPIIKAAKVAKKPPAKDKKKPKQLQILKKKATSSASSNHKAKLSALLPDVDSSDEERLEKNDHKEDESLLDKNAEDSSEGEQESPKDGGDDEDALDPDGKRAITYQISKNKGLLPSRRKEQRNPRVKYRRKYSTKLKKRKGQVREVRRELKRYEGEASGIKSHTIKSIKIK